MAARLGAEFVDMEMMQFHPTGILAGDSIATGGLLEEGLRGAGARLYNALGERYMERYSPDKLERATRDVVSRSGYMEIMAGRGTPSGGVLIDATHIKDVAKHFAGMVDRCREYGFDLVNDRVEVSPSSHYHMGGIRIDVDCHTSIDGLFAAGEDAGGVHGANRLGGNGVADSIVFGARAGDAMAEYISTTSNGEAASAAVSAKSQVNEICTRWIAPLNRPTGENPFHLRDHMECVMWTKVGVVRNGKDMQEALPEIQAIRQRVKSASGNGGPIYNAPWNETINTENLSFIAEMLTRSALAREESRGAHYRSDFPTQKLQWLKNIRLRAARRRRLRNDDDTSRIHATHARGIKRTSRARRPKNTASHRRRIIRRRVSSKLAPIQTATDFAVARSIPASPASASWRLPAPVRSR